MDRGRRSVGVKSPRLHNEGVNGANNGHPVPHRGWTTRRSAGSAQRFHDLDPAADSDHEIWIHQVDHPTVVFGSTQLRSASMIGNTPVAAVAPENGFDCDTVEVCRRRSGGGLVVLRPGDVWIDAVVPHGSPLHSDDVGRAFHWLGRAWLDALRELLPRNEGAHQSLRLAEPPAGRRVAERPFFCFADVGHGEVLSGDHKVVGISQRRTRSWTRLQTLMVPTWPVTDVDRLVACALARVEGAGTDRRDMGAPPYEAAAVKAGFAPDRPTPDTSMNEVVEALLNHLPAVEPTRPAGDRR